MLTIKYIDEFKKETVISAVSVEFNPATSELIGYGAASEVSRFTSGHAFVMNANGKTVGVYNLRRNKKQ